MDAPTTKIGGKEVPVIYADGMEIGISNSGLRINLSTYDSRVLVLLLPFSTGKTMSDGLKRIYEAWEKLSGSPQLDHEEMGKVVNAIAGELGVKAVPVEAGAQAQPPA